MANLTCPGCGSLYPLEVVRGRPQFTCAVCHQDIVVPLSGPSPSAATPRAPQSPRAAPAPRPAPTPVPPPPAVHPAARGAAPPARPSPRPAAPPPVVTAPVVHAPVHTTHGRRRAAKPQTAVLLSVAAVVVIAVVALVATQRGGSPAEGPRSAGAGAGPAAPSAPSAPKADPFEDMAAWGALAPAERQTAVRTMLAGLDPKKESALWWAAERLRERGEKEALRKVGTMALALDPNALWARDALGQVQIRKEIEDALAQCPNADELEVAPILELKELRRDVEPKDGKWWADPETAERVRGLLARIRAEEERLKSPYERAKAKWIVYQAKLEVMRDHPSIHEAVGPYLIFVQVKAPHATPLAKVEPAELQRAQRVLRQNVTLFREFHEAWSSTLGTALGLPRYGPENVDETTLLKVNIFADETNWRRYHERRGVRDAARSIRAYYEADEPRFIVSHDGPSGETSDETDQIQCHEATHQIVHFASWDLTRIQQGGREVPWAHCNAAPHWQKEGFAEFFSSHRRENGRYVWMQPLPSRMQNLWVFPRVLAKRKWANWSLAELLGVRTAYERDEIAAGRATSKPYAKQTRAEREEVARVVPVMANLFYARAWSLVHFCWHAQDAQGRPRWRDGYMRFLRRTLLVNYAQDPKLGLVPVPATADDFRKDMGLADDARFAQFEREWEDFEAELLKKHHARGWETDLKRMLAEW